MTNGASVLHLLRRGWYFYVAAFLVSAAVIYLSGSSPRIYTGEVYVSFDPPAQTQEDEGWVDYTETLINYSEVIDRTYDAAEATVALSSPKATLFGNGVREGTSVELLTSGNQWVKQLDRPVIVINVSSTSAEETSRMLKDAAARLTAMSQRIQTDLGIPTTRHILTSWDQQEFAVGSYGRTRQGTVKGAVALIMAAGVFATLASFLVNHLVRDHRREPSGVARQ